MRSLILIIILSIVLFGCGFNPIYSTKNSNFEIVELINKDENKNSFAIEKMITSLSDQNAVNKVKLEMNYKQTFSTILKDSKGDPSKKKLSITVSLVIKNEQDNFLINKDFSEEFSYDVQSNKFNMSQYEDSITNNLNNKISNDIIFFLGTLR